MNFGSDHRQQGNKGNGGSNGATAPVTKSRLSRIGGFFKPDFGTGPQQVREQHGMFLTILAMLFGSAGVLEREHPYLQPNAKFSIGELFGATLARTDFKNKQRLPQTVYFCAVWGLLASSILYALTALLLFVAAPAHAYADTGTEPGGVFDETTDKPSTDTAGMFSVPDDDLAQQFLHNIIEGKEIKLDDVDGAGHSSGVLNGGDILQGALRDMLQYYSKVVLVFASFLLLWHIINLIVSSAWSGKPLEGANAIWGPVRLVLAIGLLVPLGDGLNTGQHIVLKLAETGSAMGTKAWNMFTTKLVERSQNFQVPNNFQVDTEFAKLILIYACQADINKHNLIPNRFITDMQLDLRDLSHNITGLGQQVASKSRTLYSLASKYQAECGKVTYPYVTDWAKSKDGTVNKNSRVFLDATALGKIRILVSNAVAKQSEILVDAARSSDPVEAVGSIFKGQYGHKGYGERLAEIYANYNGDNGDTLSTSQADALTQLQKEISDSINNFHKGVQDSVSAALADSSSFDWITKSSWVLAGGYYLQASAFQNTVFSAATGGPEVELGRCLAAFLPRIGGPASSTRYRIRSIQAPQSLQ